MTDAEWLDKSEEAWKKLYGDWVPPSLKDVPRLFVLARQGVRMQPLLRKSRSVVFVWGNRLGSVLGHIPDGVQQLLAEIDKVLEEEG